MKTSMPLPIDLRGLIIFFVLLAVLMTLVSSFIVAYRVQRDALVHSTLEANAAYAAKVASSISEFLDLAHGHLNYSAEVLATHWNDPVVLREEPVRLQEQDTDFNSIVIMDGGGWVLRVYPDALQIVRSTLRSEGIPRALTERHP
ncbi:hypothetical protein [Pseudomonas fluorescens]|uniref:Uncharacterized protein n=1 Tax=Pseudomonas fluorescens TaxID=294 RepID=A0A5E7PZ72_PSEFL|nr:hypothetical protein [Pseudomonas fluorescens]VVP54831.1 hypothetical protein PS880_05610 [Pseudomonas fluorescens]